MLASIVLTTIHEPKILSDYRANLEKFGHLDEVDVFLMLDRTIDANTRKRCDDLIRDGLHLKVMTVEDQESFLASVGLESGFIPYDSDNRRNVGYLAAYAGAAPVVISIDDDNYPMTDVDFINEHVEACLWGKTRDQVVIGSTSGWYNVCEDLILSGRADYTFARGYPMFARDHRSLTSSVSRRDVDINAGLWLGDPDVDAMTWLIAPVRSIGWHGASVVLDRDTWSPINTQNTSLKRDAVPAYYYLPMGIDIGQGKIDRYGDIFSGYFVEACAKHLGKSVRFGSPIADHRRNSHSYIKDAAQEMTCVALCDDLLRWLPKVKLSGSTYGDAYRSLADQLSGIVLTLEGFAWNAAAKSYFIDVSNRMRAWELACQAIEGRI